MMKQNDKFAEQTSPAKSRGRENNILQTGLSRGQMLLTWRSQCILQTVWNMDGHILFASHKYGLNFPTIYSIDCQSVFQCPTVCFTIFLPNHTAQLTFGSCVYIYLCLLNRGFSSLTLPDFSLPKIQQF